MLMLLTLIVIQGVKAAELPVLKVYIEQGLKSNLALQQKKLDYEKSFLALKKARGLFLPSLAVDARYSRAGGGRTIDFPLGDLVNPVYVSLNQIFSAIGQPTQNFPLLQNQQIPFLRKKEHDTKLRLVQPLFQPAIYFNMQLKKQQQLGQQAAINSYKNTLVRDISLAYYNYLQAGRSVAIYQSAQKVVRENVAVSQSLLRNGVVTGDVLFRAEAAQAHIEQQLSNALSKQQIAGSYFNFLLNRAMDDTIQVSDVGLITGKKTADLQELRHEALINRYEFLQIQKGQLAQKAVARLNSTKYLPVLNLVVDYGFQGENYRFSKEDDYWMASAVLQWNLFNGGQDEADRQIAMVSFKQLQLREQELSHQIVLDVDTQYRQLINLQKTFIAAQKESHAAQKAFEIIRSQYRSGQAPLITFMDAREKMTQARISREITKIEITKQRVRLAAATGMLVQPYLDKEK